jgi:hypothetical protein
MRRLDIAGVARAALHAQAAALAEAVGGVAVADGDGVVVRLAGGQRREFGAPGRPPQPVLADAVAEAMPGILQAVRDAMAAECGEGG